MYTTKIFVAYDAPECETIGAAETMDEAIMLVIRYMYSHDYVCKYFSHDEEYTVISYEHDYRIGPEMNTINGTISIMATALFKSDE